MFLKMFLRYHICMGIKYGFWVHVLLYTIKYIDDDDDDDDIDDDDDDDDDDILMINILTRDLLCHEIMYKPRSFEAEKGTLRSVWNS